MTDIKFILLFMSVGGLLKGFLLCRCPFGSLSPTDGGRASAGTSRHFAAVIPRSKPMVIGGKFIKRGKIPFFKIELLTQRGSARAHIKVIV